MTQETNQDPSNEQNINEELSRIESQETDESDETVQVDTKSQTSAAGFRENTTTDIRQEALKALQMDAEHKRMEEAQQRGSGHALFTKDMILKLEIKDSGRFINNLVHRDLVVGRADNMTDYAPEVDMTDHGAYRLGLSRRHAIIQRDGDSLVVKDLNSRNGTFVNGAIVPGGSTHPIKDGDELRFGNLVTRVIFEQPS